MFQAIRGNDLGTVKALPGAGTDVNEKDKRGTTPLMYASAFGSVESLKILVDAGANVNARNSFDATALMWAVNDVDKVRVLIAKGADVNAKSKMGRAPLLMAAMDSRGAPVVKLLLSQGAQVDARDSIRTTRAHPAAHRDRT